MVLSAVGLRKAVGTCGLVLPPLLLIGGWWLDVPVQDNLSSYVHTPMRDVLVGILAAIAALLFCYHGKDQLENLTANLGSLFAVGLAVCPIDAGSDPLAQRSLTGWLHSVSGGGFFLVLAIYSLWHFPSSRTKPAAPAPSGREKGTDFRNSKRLAHANDAFGEQRDFIYRVCGIVILLSMLVMGTYLTVFPTRWVAFADKFHALFWLEWAAVWAFAAAWLTKGRSIVADLAVEWLAITQRRYFPTSSPR